MALSRPLSRSLSRALSRAISGGIGLIKRLLDLYPGAAAAYSLQDIGGGGNVIRARRSSDNEESDFTASDITGGALTSWAGVGDAFVTTWYDQSGNSRDATQTTAASQPQIVDGGVIVTDSNGNPAVDFDGTNHDLLTGTISEVTGNPDHAAFCLAQLDGANINYESFLSIGYGSGATRGTSLLGVDNNNNSWAGGDDLVSPSGGTYGTTSPRLLSKSHISGTTEGFDNGASMGTSVNAYSLNAANQYIALGGYDSSSPQRIEGRICEAVVYLSDQSANRAEIEAEVAARYDITLS